MSPRPRHIFCAGRICAAAAAALALCACGPSGTPADIAAEKGILLIGNAADPASLDPALATGFGEFKILSGLFEGLVGANPKTLEPEPAVAKSWEILDGGKNTCSISTKGRSGQTAPAWRRATSSSRGGARCSRKSAASTPLYSPR